MSNNNRDLEEKMGILDVIAYIVAVFSICIPAIIICIGSLVFLLFIFKMFY